MRPIYDQADLFYQLTKCLEERDLDALQFIENEICDWLQPSDLTAAQIALIEVIRDVMYEVES